MIRVLMVLTKLGISDGVTNFAMNYYRVLNKDEIHIDFAVYKEEALSPYTNEIKRNGGEVFVLSFEKNLWKHICECRNILQSRSYDIIHDNSMINTIPLMWCAKKKIPIRIFHCHSSKFGETPPKNLRNKLLFPILKNMATGYAACSSLAGKALLGSRSFTVIPNLIDVNKFQFNHDTREKVRNEQAVNDKYVVGSVGRLTYAKNPFFALDVIAELAKLCPQVEYWWVGDGPIEQKVRDYVNRLHINKHVKLFGKRDDVNKLYQAMDCFLLPSKFEGLGIVALEAQASGLPVVLSDSVPEEVKLSSTVKTCRRNEDKQKWAEQIYKIRGMEINRYKGAEYVRESGYDIVKKQNPILAFYKKLLGEMFR